MDHKFSESVKPTVSQPPVSDEIIVARLLELAKNKNTTDAVCWAYYLAAAELGNFEANVKIFDGNIVNFNVNKSYALERSQSSQQHGFVAINCDDGDEDEKKRVLKQLMSTFQLSACFYEYMREASNWRKDAETPFLDMFRAKMMLWLTADMRQAFSKGIDWGFHEAALLEAACIVLDKNRPVEVNLLRRINLCYQVALTVPQKEVRFRALALNALEEEAAGKTIANCHAKLKLFLLYYLGAPGIAQDIKKALHYIVIKKEIYSELLNLLLGEIQQRLLQISSISDVLANERTKQVQEVRELFSAAEHNAAAKDKKSDLYIEVTGEIQKVLTASLASTTTSSATNSKLDDDKDSWMLVDGPVSLETSTAPASTAASSTTNFFSGITQTLRGWSMSSNTEYTVLTEIEQSSASNLMTEQENGEGKGKFNPYGNENL